MRSNEHCLRRDNKWLIFKYGNLQGAKKGYASFSAGRYNLGHDDGRDAGMAEALRDEFADGCPHFCSDDNCPHKRRIQAKLRDLGVEP